MIKGLAILIAYLLGSIPVSVLVSKLIHKDDIRRHGSGNPGASNMTRTFGLKSGALTLIGDAGKGLLGTLIGLWLCGEPGMYYCAIAAVLGHNWPIFLKFKGGKGVATSFGVMLAIMPWLALGCFVVFILVALLTRYFSLASIVALLLFWVVVIVTRFGDVPLFLTTTFLVWMSIWRHWPNIKRLANGTENKINL